ncbi:MAG: NHL repeat-containing protein [Planctomycetota bacterium]
MPDQSSENKKAVGIVIGVIAVVALVPALLIVGGFVVYMVLASRVSVQKPSGLPDEYDYGVEKLQVIDPKLIAYREAATIALPFEQPRGVAVDQSDRIYAAGDHQIVVFGSDGARQSSIQTAGPPQALAVADDGAIFAATTDHVEVYAPDGERRASWDSLGEKAMVTSIAVADDAVFVADAGNRIVVHYDREGKLLGRIGKKDPERGVPGFLIPSPYFDLAVGPSGMLWVVNPGRRRVELYLRNGDLELAWGQSGTRVEAFSGCCNPSHIALLPDGGVVTSEKGTVRVKVYDAHGALRCVVGAAPDPFDADDLDLDLAVDSAGRILVLDPNSKLLRIFTRKKDDGQSNF